MSINVAIIDDHPLVLSGLDAALETVPDVRVVARGGTIAEARAILGRADIDLALLDIRLADGNSLELLASTTTEPRCRVVILSSFEAAQYVAAAVRFGAHGFMLKTAPLPDIVAAIRAVAGGGSAFTDAQRLTARRSPRLTGREREIVKLVVEGRSNDEIARAVGASRRAVEAHLSHLYERLAISNRVELALRAERDGWLDVKVPPDRPHT